MVAKNKKYIFIGWDLLCSLTLGIGNLWLRPYKQAVEAAFYRDISGTTQNQQPFTAPEAENSWHFY